MSLSGVQGSLARVLNWRKDFWELPSFWWSFAGSASDKESAYQCRRRKWHGLLPWVGKIPWRRAWQPSRVFCLENPMDRGAWQAAVHRVAQSWTRLKRLSTPARPVGGGWYFIYALLTPRITLSMMHLGCPGVWGACWALYVGMCVWFQVLRAPGDSAGPPRRKELHVTSWLRRGGPTGLTFPAPGSWSAS